MGEMHLLYGGWEEGELCPAALVFEDEPPDTTPTGKLAAVLARRASGERVSDADFKVVINAASAAVRREVKAGRLAKSATCERCGGSEIIQAHHHKGYEPEQWLDVQWLCWRCHFQQRHGIPYESHTPKVRGS
jgi:ribosomal protein S27AE